MKKQTSIIKLIYFLKFFADAIFSGYLSMYFEKFFSRFSFEYGLLLGIIPFCALLGNFIWGSLSKGSNKNLLLIKIILSLESFAMIIFVSLGKDFISLLICTILFGLFNSPCFTMQDGLSSAYSKQEKTSYPSIRYMGSSGYLVALLTGSVLLNVFYNNYMFIFIISIILNIICLIMWFFIKPLNISNETIKDKIKFIDVIKNKTFILYFIAYLLIIGSNNVADSFLFSRLKEVNVTESTYSLIFASEIFIEIIVLILSDKFIKEDKYLLVLKVSSIILFLRAFLFGFNLPLNILIFIAPFRGIGWGGFLSVHLLLLRKVVSNKLVTKAISLLTIFLSLINGLMTIIGPSIYQAISLPYFYLLLSTLIFIGIIILITMKFNFKEDIGENLDEVKNI